MKGYFQAIKDVSFIWLAQRETNLIIIQIYIIIVNEREVAEVETSKQILSKELFKKLNLNNNNKNLGTYY